MTLKDPTATGTVRMGYNSQG